MSPSGRPSSGSAASADPWLGRVVGGRWKILSLLDDSGGMASVYLADDLRLPRQAVVKIPKAAHQNAEFAERFTREAFHHAQVQNVHVVNILDRGEEAGTPFLVLQYLSGGNLRAWCTRQASMLADPRLHFEAWLLPVAQALDAVAAKGIVHRDVKPTNILFDADGKGYLSDFGIVKAGSEATLTGTGLFIGTLQFMSPEQCQPESKRELDGRSDQYGLAVTVYQVLTGWQYPVEDDTAVVYAAKFGHVAMKHPREHVPLVPEAVNDAVMRALSPDRQKRFATSVEFAEAVLAGFGRRSPPQSGDQRTSHRLTCMNSPMSRVATGTYRRPAARFAVASMLLAAGGVALLATMWRLSNSQSPPRYRHEGSSQPTGLANPRDTTGAAPAFDTTPEREPEIDFLEFTRVLAGGTWNDVNRWLDDLEAEHPRSLAPAAFRVQLLFSDCFRESRGDDARRRAAALANEALRRNPNDPWANLAKARVLLEEGNVDEALPRVDAAIMGLPGRTCAEILKVWVLAADDERRGEGITLARDMVRRHPDDPEACNCLGTQLFNADEFTEGLPFVERACSLAPQVAVFWNNKGYGLRHMKRFDEAAAAYERAIAVAPTRPQYILGRANVLNDMGRTDDALAEAGHAIRVAPDEPEGYVAKANLLAAGNNWRDADDVLSQGIGRIPDDWQLWDARAAVRLQLREFQDAASDAMRVKLLTADPLRYGLRLAVALAYLDDMKESLATVTRLIDLKPDREHLVQAYELRIAVYRKLGREADARADEATVATLKETKD